MRKIIRSVVVGLGLVAVAQQEARALDVAGHAVSYCLHKGAFTACASATITVVGTSLTAVVRNISNSAGDTEIGRLTEFGFFYLAAAPTGGSASLTSENLPTVWADLDNTKGLGYTLGADGDFIGGARTTFWNDHSLAPGLAGTFVFSLAPGTDWSRIGLAWRGQTLSNGVVNAKCYDGLGASRHGECVATGEEEPPVSVPEPTAMLLLATGLLGLAGAGAVGKSRKA